MSTNLDASYFSSNPTPPWVLSTDNTAYVLTVDVDVNTNYGGGQLFKLTGKNQSFDPNGHYIRNNGVDIPQNTRSGNFADAAQSQYEVPAQNINELGLNNEWASFKDIDMRHNSDTGGLGSPATETSTSVAVTQPHGGVAATGRGK